MAASVTKQYPLAGEFIKGKDSAFPEKRVYKSYFAGRLHEECPCIGDKTAKHLIRTYGDRSFDLIKLIEEDPKLAEKIHPDYPYILAEVTYSIRNEMALNPIDFLFRRVSLGFLDENATKLVYDRVNQHFK